jgi:methionyl-tRNA formyltransferase
LIVWRARVTPSDPADEAGRIAAVGGDGLALATASGRLLLDEVQLAGKKRVSAAELRRGYPGLIG